MPRESSTQSANVKRPGSLVRKLSIAAAVIAVLVILGWESWQRVSYRSTLSAVQKAKRQARKQTDVAFTIEDARPLFQGWTAETTIAEDPQQVIDVTWLSMFQDLRARFQFEKSGNMVAVQPPEKFGERVSGAPEEPASASNERFHELCLVRLPPLFPLGRIGLSPTDKPVVLLDDGDGPMAQPDIEHGLLIQELGRQSLLIAAHSELSVPVRDRALGESFPTIQPPIVQWPVGVISSVRTDGEALISIYRYMNRERRPPVAQVFKTIKLQLGKDDHLVNLAAELEPLLRTEFVDALKSFGYTGSPRTFVAEGALPDDIAQKVLQYDAVSQLVSLRTVHSEIQQHGESIPRLAALAQGYAQLGMLTEGLWSRVHKTFKARALLYAERLKQKAPKHPAALWTRGYVRALVGLPNAALVDIAAAKQAQEESAAQPFWAPVIKAYCQADEASLDRLSQDEPTALLASHLQLAAAELTENTAQRLKAATRVLQLSPECVRAWSLLAQDHRLEDRLRVAELLYTQLHALTETPDDLNPLRLLLALEGRDVQERSKQLRELCADANPQIETSELRNAVLKNLIQESSFVLAVMAVDLHRETAKPDADDLILQVQKLYGSHPFVAYLGSKLQRHPKELADGIRSFKSLQPWSGVETTEVPFHAVLDAYQQENDASVFRRVMLKHSDSVLRDLSVFARLSPESGDRQRAVRTMRAISPVTPQIAAASIRHDRDAVKDLIAGWNDSFAKAFDYLPARAEQLEADLELSEAVGVLERQLEIEPTIATANQLARLYDELGEDEKRNSILERALKLPMGRSDRTKAQIELARHYMANQAWDAARPHADAAAESEESAALVCAADCYEGAGNWEKAEHFQRLNSEKHEHQALRWFVWCCATNHGDINAARTFLEPKLKSWRTTYTRDAYSLLANYTLLEADKSGASDLFNKTFDAKALMALGAIELKPVVAYGALGFWKPPSYAGIHAALLADQFGEFKKRNELLLRCCNGTAAEDPELAELAHYFRTNFTSNGGTPVDPKKIEWLLQRSASIEIMTDVLYFTGRFWELRGNNDLARHYYERAVSSSARQQLTRAFAAQALRKMGVDAPAAVPMIDSQIDKAFEISRRAAADFRNGSYQRALWRCERALKIAPDFGSLYFTRGRVFSEQEQREKALADYDRLAQLITTDPTIHCMRGFTLEILGRHADAIVAYEKALLLQSNHGTACNNLALLYGACIDPNYRDAQKSMQYSLRMKDFKRGTSAQQLSCLGVAHAAAGDFSEAVAKTKRAMEHGGPEMRELLARRLERFEQGKPYIREDKWWMGTKLAAEDRESDSE